MSLVSPTPGVQGHKAVDDISEPEPVAEADKLTAYFD